jgi:Flp pilus assembly secretin CpaC
VFIRGLEMALFPLGEALATSLAQRGSLVFLMVFAFSLGFGTTVAEPALIAVSQEATRVMAAAGVIETGELVEARYAKALRYTVAVSVGVSLMLGVVRILKGWPIQWLIIGGYVLVVALTMIAPDAIIGIAYDSGGVTTSTITVPLVTALGVGLASVIRGRNPMIDGFGLIAFASLMPIIFVLIFGLVISL